MLFTQRIIWLYFLLALGTHLSAQEVCDDGRDNDGDGLIDLQDTTDCACNLLNAIPSLLPNPSFEDYDPSQQGCDSGQADGSPDASGQADCLTGWFNANSGTADTWDAFTFWGDPWFFPAQMPLPIPNGSRAVGLWTGLSIGGTTNPRGFQPDSRREYLAGCVNDGGTLDPGIPYRISLSVGYVPPDDTYLFPDGLRGVVRTPFISSPERVKLALYGIRQCDQVRYLSSRCPGTVNAEGWVLIGEFDVDGTPGSWTATTFDFTVPESFAAVAIGGSCQSTLPPEELVDWFRYYYYFDNLRLNRVEVFDQLTVDPVTVTGQSLCGGEVIFEAPERAGYGYQWYKDGIALPGATSPRLLLSPSADLTGEYRLRTIIGGDCSLSNLLRILRPRLITSFLPDTITLCAGEPYEVAGDPNRPYTYRWWDGDTTATSREITRPGDYMLTVYSACDSVVHRIHARTGAGPEFQLMAAEENNCFQVGQDASLRVLGSENFTRFQVFGEATNGDLTSYGVADATATGGRLDIFNLSLPTLLVVGSDGGCQRDSVRIRLSEGPALSVRTSLQTLNCALTLIDAEAEVSAGTPPYTYQWGAAAGANIIGEARGVEGLVAGIYGVTVTDAGGCRVSTTFTAAPPDTLSVNDIRVSAECGADGTQLTVKARGGRRPYFYGLSSFPSGADSVFRVPNSNSYVVTVRDAAGCSVTAPAVRVDAAATFSVQASVDRTLRLGETAQLRAELSGGDVPEATYEWFPADGLSCTDCPDPLASPGRVTDYTVRVSSPEGCRDSASVRVVVDNLPRYYFPTAFSPNADGVNDRFRVFAGPGVAELLELQVFDRWGQPVFSATDLADGWDGLIDGQAATGGVYVYSGRLLLVDGRAVDFRGEVVLVR